VQYARAAVCGVAGASNASGSDANAQGSGHGEGDGRCQGCGNDASGNRDLLHLDGFGGRLLFVVAQGVSCGG